MGVTASFLHLSVVKDTIIENIIDNYCISLGLEKIRTVEKRMLTLGVSIVFLLFSFPTFYGVSNHNNDHFHIYIGI